MSPAELRRCCLSKPSASEDFPFGEQVSVFKVADRVFAIADLDGVPFEVSVKSDPDVAEALRSTRPAIRPGYHLNKRHWITVTLDGSISDGEIDDMIQDSYDLVAAKLTRAKREEIGLETHQPSPPARGRSLRRSASIEGCRSPGVAGHSDKR
jgi:predicted DNA-binding protein (MmcQ/YjbR family)